MLWCQLSERDVDLSSGLASPQSAAIARAPDEAERQRQQGTRLTSPAVRQISVQHHVKHKLNSHLSVRAAESTRSNRPIKSNLVSNLQTTPTHTSAKMDLEKLKRMQNATRTGMSIIRRASGVCVVNY